MIVIKVYTPSRNFPVVVGKFTNGKPIPFGPFTLPQIATGVSIVVAFAAVGMLSKLSPLWVLGLVVVGAICGAIGVVATGQIAFDGVPTSHRLMRAMNLILARRPVSATGESYTVDGQDSVLMVGDERDVYIDDHLKRPYDPASPTRNGDVA